MIRRRTPLKRAHLTARKGPEARRRAAKRRKVVAAMNAAKRASKARDGWMCVRCSVLGRVPADMAALLPAAISGGVPLDSAHIDDMGMGGDPKLLRSGLPSDYVTLCRPCHRALHDHQFELVVGPRRGDGPVTFKARQIA